jgi:hypothetical protein
MTNGGLEPVGNAVPMTHQDRQWAELAAKRELEGLATIRGLAEKWAASLTGVLGVVGLAALIDKAETFGKLDSPWKEIAEVSFLLALVLTLVASAFAIAAAQGTSQRFFIPSGAALRLYSIQAVDDALRYLKRSRILALLATIGVLIAGVCLWFGDQAQGGPTVIEVPDAAGFCAGVTDESQTSDSDSDFLLRCGR